MFSKKDVTYKGASGNTYYLDKQFKSQGPLSFHYASDKEGRDYIAKVVDLGKATFDAQLLQRFLKARHDYEGVDNPNVIRVHDKIVKDDKLVLITSDHEAASFADIVLKENNPYDEASAREIILSVVGAYQAVQKHPPSNGCRELYHHICIANMYLKSAELQIGGWDTGELGHLFYLSSHVPLCFKPPEAIQGKEVDNDSAIVWMLGVSFFALLFSALPFAPKTAADALRMFKESGGLNLRFPSHKTVSAQAKNFISKSLEFDPALRPTLRQILNDPYLGADRKRKVQEPPRTGPFEKHNMSHDLPRNHSNAPPNANSLPYQKTLRLSYENYEEINLKPPTGIKVQTLPHLDPLLSSQISVDSSDFGFSNSSASFDYQKNELVNEDETGYTYFRENNSGDAFLFYIYEKNKIILLMDAMIKMREAETSKALADLAFDFFYLQILTIKKASIQNVYIIEVMRNKLDLFGLPDFDEVTRDSEYQHLLSGFIDLDASLKALFRKLAEDCRRVYDSEYISFRKIDDYRLSEIGEHFSAIKARLVSFYTDNKTRLGDAERLLVMQVVALVRYINDMETYFVFEKFRTTRDWVVFLKTFATKKVAELENILLM